MHTKICTQYQKICRPHESYPRSLGKISNLNHYLLENCKGLCIFEHRVNFSGLVLSGTQLVWDLEEGNRFTYLTAV